MMKSNCEKIEKAFIAFEHSLSRIKDLPVDPNILTDDDKEHWEAYCARFARIQDLLVKRFFRLLAIEGDPAWSGSVRDLLNLMEKRRIISSSSEWMALRELRNEISHEYEEDALSALYKRARDAASIILAVKSEITRRAN